MTVNIDVEVTQWVREAQQRVGRELPRLEEALRQALCTADAEQLSLGDIDFTAQSLIMQYQYPEQFVVFRESDEERAGCQRYVVDILFSSKSWDDICRFLAHCGDSFTVEYQPNPYELRGEIKVANPRMRYIIAELLQTEEGDRRRELIRQLTSIVRQKISHILGGHSSTGR